MPQVIASVKALIQKDDKFLFIYSPAHKEVWDLPGGKIEYGEEPEEALRREVLEEVGLSIRIEKLIGIWWFYSKNSLHQVVCPTFLCGVDKKESVNLEASKEVGEQITEYKWLTREGALSSIQLSESLMKLLRELK